MNKIMVSLMIVMASSASFAAGTVVESNLPKAAIFKKQVENTVKAFKGLRGDQITSQLIDMGDEETPKNLKAQETWKVTLTGPSSSGSSEYNVVITEKTADETTGIDGDLTVVIKSEGGN